MDKQRAVFNRLHNLELASFESTLEIFEEIYLKNYYYFWSLISKHESQTH